MAKRRTTRRKKCYDDLLALQERYRIDPELIARTVYNFEEAKSFECVGVKSRAVFYRAHSIPWPWRVLGQAYRLLTVEYGIKPSVWAHLDTNKLVNVLGIATRDNARYLIELAKSMPRHKFTEYRRKLRGIPPRPRDEWGRLTGFARPQDPLPPRRDKKGRFTRSNGQDGIGKK